MERKRKKWLIVAIVAAVAIVALAVILLCRKDRIEVQTATVETAEQVRSFVTASGEIRAKEFVDIQAEVPGIIVDLPVKEGERVQVGDVLLKIDQREIDADVQAAQANHGASVADAKRFELAIETAKIEAARSLVLLELSKTELMQAEANRDRAKASYQRKKELHANGALPTEEFEIAETALHITQSLVETGRARVSQTEVQVTASGKAIDEAVSAHDASKSRIAVAKANLFRAEEQLRKTIIKSPLTGIITKLNVEKGERAVPGILSNPQATLMTIADMSVVQAEIEVSEVDIITVAMGDLAEVTVDALGETKLHGKVVEIGQSPINASDLARGTSSQEAKDFEVKITIDDPPAILRPGLSASADITTEIKENVTVIPIQAVTMREVIIDDAGSYVTPVSRKKPARKAPTAGAAASSSAKEKREERKGVFVRAAGNVAPVPPIVTGATGDMEVEVVEGLVLGEEIITGPYKVLRTIEEGDFLRINNEFFTELEPVRKRKK